MNSRLFLVIVSGILSASACRKASVPDLGDSPAPLTVDGALALDGAETADDIDGELLPTGGSGPEGQPSSARAGAEDPSQPGRLDGDGGRAADQAGAAGAGGHAEPAGIGASSAGSSGGAAGQMAPEAGTTGASGSSAAVMEGASGAFVSGAPGSNATGGSESVSGLSGSITSGVPGGVVQFLNVQSDGGTSSDAFATTLGKAKQRYRSCFGRAQAAGIEPTGTLKLRATISADGKIESVSVLGGNVTPGVLVQCTVAVTRGLKVGDAAAPSSRAVVDIKYSRG